MRLDPVSSLAMPGILFRHIFVELLKVLTVTTAVLVTVIAFGAAIKPLSENLLGPTDLLKYILFATIPMMQYALPFAAAYAGTIVYHRLATDNEISAMATSGIPYRRVLMPAVALGLVLTVVMGVLVDTGVPTFWQAMKRIAWNDVTRILAAQVRRGEAMVLGEVRTEIYADDAYVDRDPAGLDGPAGGAADWPAGDGAVRPDQRLILDRVVALQMDDDGAPRTEFTAQAATADQYRVRDSAYLKIVLSNATIFSRGDGRFARAAIVRPDAITMPSFEQGPKGLSIRELLAARRRLSVFPAVADAESDLNAVLTSIDIWRSIDATIGAGKPLVLLGTGDAEGTTLELRAARLVGRDLRGAEDAAKGEGVTIAQYEGSGASRTLRREVTAPAVRLTLGDLTAGQAPRLDVAVENGLVIDRRLGDRGVRRSLRLDEFAIADVAPSAAAGRDTPDLLALARSTTVGAGPVESLEKSLRSTTATLEAKVRDLSNDIVARLVQRSAQSITALLMVVNAAILAILLRSKPALLVYVVGFVPAILDILLISGGEQMLRGRLSWLGYATCFSGNVLLLGGMLLFALKLRRH